MKNSVLFIFLFMTLSTYSQDLITKVEAENSNYSGLTISSSLQGYSGTGYLTGFDSKSDYSTLSVTVPSSGYYELHFGYRSADGVKKQNISINNTSIGVVEFPYSTIFTSFYFGQVYLNNGVNDVKIISNWGYIDLDYISIHNSIPHDYNKVVSNLIDPKASAETVRLYDFLRFNYGETILAGQNFYWNELIEKVQKTPILQSFDFQNYSPQNPWGWDNNTSVFKSWDDGTTVDIAKWYKESDGCGMVSIQWHWFSPSGGTLRKSTFYTDETTFDVEKAVQVGTTEYQEVIRDIDAIAVQLQRLQSANIPVLWRPLHEAGGDWFWWGAKGPEAAKKLWDIMYDRITNYHDIHNLIWVWSTPEAAYYPGNSKVDIFGYDSYPGAFEYGAQKTIFDQMYSICEGEKLLALTENGPIPAVDECFSKDAKWAYFCSWSDLVAEQNSESHLLTTFSHADVTTLDEKCVTTSIDEDKSLDFSFYPNPSSDYIKIEGVKVDEWEIMSLSGKTIINGFHSNNINVESLQPGVYLLKVNNALFKKVIKE